jgi:hypothetical protein
MKKAILFVVLGLILVCSAASDNFHSQYPGRFSVNGSSGWKNVALQSLSLAVIAYYRVHERWPKDWKEVKSSGIFQQDLFGPEFQPVSPDDGKLDFEYDVFYRLEGGVPTILSMAGGKAITSQIKTPKTYRQKLTAWASKFPQYDANYWLNDPKRLVHLAHMMQLQQAVREYTNTNNRKPTTVQEILTSGWSPLSETSKSPYSGKPYRFDGSANDFKFVAGNLTPVDNAGRPVELYGMW